MQSALLDGKEILAWELTDAEFAAVRHCYKSDANRLRFRDGLSAIPRGGPQTRNHFAHRAGEGGQAFQETPFHIAAKAAIHKVARSRGWNATVEARGPAGEWQADVLLTRDEQWVAFEVQWSSQPSTEFERRTQRYRAAGIETVWLARSSRTSYQDLIESVDVLPINKRGLGLDAIYPLEDCIDACLEILETGKPRFASQPILRQRCRRCDRNWFSTHSPERWGSKRPFSETELLTLGEWAGELREDFSHTLGERYMMWHCPHCGAKCGDFYLQTDDWNMVAGGTVVRFRPSEPLWNGVEELLRERGAVPLVTRSDGRRPEALQSSSEPRLREIDAEAASDDRHRDDPERIKALYARTARAGAVISERHQGRAPH